MIGQIFVTLVEIYFGAALIGFSVLLVAARNAPYMDDDGNFYDREEEPELPAERPFSADDERDVREALDVRQARHLVLLDELAARRLSRQGRS